MNTNHIAMISYHTCPLAAKEGSQTGGMNVYVLEVAKQLSDHGHVVDIYTRCESEKNARIVSISPTLRVIHLQAGPAKVMPKRRLVNYLPEFICSLADFVKQQPYSYDVLDCHYYLSGLIGLELQKKLHLRIPLVITFHTLALMKNLVARDDLEQEQMFRIKAEKELTRSANAIIAPSENEKNYLEYLYGTPREKLHVIAPGIDHQLFRPIDKAEAKKYVRAKQDEQIILFVGRIEPLKGIDSLIYALRILLERKPKLPVALWIVGGDISQPSRLWSKELRKLEQMRRALELRSKVKFVGQRSQEELVYFYNAAEVVVMPSHYESFGMVALEAMACGTPVITTNITGVSSILDEAHEALITSVNNPLFLASQLEFLLTNKHAREHISGKILQQIKKYTWQETARQVSLIYKAIQ